MVSINNFRGVDMSKKIDGIGGKLVSSVFSSRRMFLFAMGNAALATAGVLASGLATRSRGSSRGRFVDSGPGACYYPSGGQICCEQCTQSQCISFVGSTWIQGGNCVLRPSA
jgi:hypothetical protein